jgi:hypothetical protein
MLLHTLDHLQHSCAINHSSKISVMPQKMIQPVYNYANVLYFHWLSVIDQNNPRSSLTVSKNWR